MIQAVAKWHHLSIVPGNFINVFLKCIKLRRNHQMYSMVTIRTFESYCKLVWMHSYYNLLDYFPTCIRRMGHYQVSSKFTIVMVAQMGNCNCLQTHDVIMVQYVLLYLAALNMAVNHKNDPSSHISIDFATQRN